MIEIYENQDIRQNSKFYIYIKAKNEAFLLTFAEKYEKDAEVIRKELKTLLTKADFSQDVIALACPVENTQINYDVLQKIGFMIAKVDDNDNIRILIENTSNFSRPIMEALKYGSKIPFEIYDIDKQAYNFIFNPYSKEIICCMRCDYFLNSIVIASENSFEELMNKGFMKANSKYFLPFPEKMYEQAKESGILLADQSNVYFSRLREELKKDFEIIDNYFVCLASKSYPLPFENGYAVVQSPKGRVASSLYALKFGVGIHNSVNCSDVLENKQEFEQKYPVLAKQEPIMVINPQTFENSGIICPKYLNYWENTEENRDIISIDDNEKI